MNTKTLIIESFLNQGMEKGIYKVTLQQIADRAGVAYSTAHYYLGGEGKLIPTVLEHVAQKAATYMETADQKIKSDQSIKPISCYIGANFSWAKENPSHFAFWIYFYYLTFFQEYFRSKNVEFTRRARSRIINYLYLEYGRQQLSLPNDVESLADSIHDHVVGSLVMFGTRQIFGDEHTQEQRTIEGVRNLCRQAQA
jgi:AcrR family transcriptional regulator